MAVKLNPFTGKLQWFNTAITSDVLFTEQYSGSDAGGSSGGTSRVLTTKGLTYSTGAVNIFVDTQHLRKTTDFTTSGNDVTLVPKIYDTQKISVSYLLKAAMFVEQYAGSDATGSNGNTSRVLTTKGMLDTGQHLHVFIDTQHLKRPAQYTLSGNKITFVGKLFDAQKIDLYFAVGKLALEQFAGSDATGNDGDANRVIAATGLSGASGDALIFVDTQHLIKTDTYIISGNNITFSIRIRDSQKIDVYYIK